MCYFDVEHCVELQLVVGTVEATRRIMEEALELGPHSLKSTLLIEVRNDQYPECRRHPQNPVAQDDLELVRSLRMTCVTPSSTAQPALPFETQRVWSSKIENTF